MAAAKTAVCLAGDPPGQLQEQKGFEHFGHRAAAEMGADRWDDAITATVAAAGLDFDVGSAAIAEAGDAGRNIG